MVLKTRSWSLLTVFNRSSPNDAILKSAGGVRGGGDVCRVCCRGMSDAVEECRLLGRMNWEPMMWL